MKDLDNFVDLDRFEEIAHILIDESLYEPLQNADLLPQLTVFEKIKDFFESELPLAHRIRRACERAGMTYALFARYASIRYDVFAENICKELAHTKITQDPVPSIREFKKDVCEFQPKLKKCTNITHVYSKDFLHTFELHYKKKKVFVQYIRPHIREQILVDLETLMSLSYIIDKSYAHILNQPIKLVVHEFLLHMYHLLNFQTESIKYKKIHSFFEKTQGIHSITIHPDTTPYVFIFSTEKQKNLLEIVTHRGVTDKLLTRLSTFLFEPLFRHNVILQPIEIDDIWVCSQQKITVLGSISYSQVSKEQVSHLGKILKSIITHDYHDCIKYFLLAHSHVYVGGSSLQNIIRDVKKYFEENISKKQLSIAMFDLISIYRKHKVPVPEVYIFFASHLRLVERIISLSDVSQNTRNLIEVHLIDILREDIQYHIQTFGNLRKIEKERHLTTESNKLQKKVLSAEETVEKLEHLTSKVIYTVLVSTFLIITTLFVLFGQSVSYIVTLPIFILGCMLIFFLIYETYKKV